MEFAILLVALAALVWAIFLVQYHDVVTGTAIFLVATSVFPLDFGALEVGVSITADRIWLAVLILQFGYDLWIGRSYLRAWSSADLFLILFLVWLVLRTVVTPIGQEMKEQPSTVMHLFNGYLVPAFLYCILRNRRPTDAAIWGGVAVMLMFGAYLSLTAVFEITKQWSLVFPAFIGDPKIGIHFGRARGPMLNSVRLGMCMCASFAILWAYPICRYPRAYWAWALAGVLTPLYLVGIFLTYTRSIWMAAMAIVVVLVLTLLHGKARITTVGLMFFAGLLGGLIVGPNLVAFKREYSAAETLESTRMRGAFAYVSWKMIQDRPLMGYGFNQFQVYNRSYLDDRTTNIRLESIRGYVHHNSFLSLLTDLGLIGGILFTLASVAMIRGIWFLLASPRAPPLARCTAIFSACVLASHVIQMAFHEVSFSSIEYALLMFGLGLTQSYRDELLAEPAATPRPILQPKWNHSWSS